MLAKPGATDPLLSLAGGSPPDSARAAFLRALGHCWRRALVVGAACAAMGIVISWLVLPSSVPAVVARLRLSRPAPQDGPDLAPLRRDLARLVKDGATLAAALDEPGVGSLAAVRERPAPVEWLSAALDVQAPAEVARKGGQKGGPERCQGARKGGGQKGVRGARKVSGPILFGTRFGVGAQSPFERVAVKDGCGRKAMAARKCGKGTEGALG